MTMTIRTGTFAINLTVFLVTQVRTGKPVSGTKVGTDCEVGFHRVSVVFGPEFGMFKQLNADEGEMGCQTLPDYPSHIFGGG